VRQKAAVVTAFWRTTVLMPGSRGDGQTMSRPCVRAAVRPCGRASVRPCGHVAVAVAAYSTGCHERLAGGADRTEFQVVPVLPAGGRATGRGNRARQRLAPTTVAAELFRLDGLGVLVAGADRQAAAAAPEFNHFAIELAPVGRFAPTLYRGTVDSILASVDPVVQGRCGGPLAAPSSRYPWSLLWRAGDSSEHVRALVDPAGSADWNPAPARD
jgi:hypothetical protein